MFLLLFSKSSSRLIAMQCIYSYLMGKNKMDPKDCFESIKCDLNIAKPNFSFVTRILSVFYNEEVALINLVEQNLKYSWPLKRVNKLIIAILLAGSSEMMIKKSENTNIDYKIIFKEYIKIADIFLEERDVMFVNAVLEKVSGMKK